MPPHFWVKFTPLLRALVDPGSITAVSTNRLPQTDISFYDIVHTLDNVHNTDLDPELQFKYTISPKRAASDVSMPSVRLLTFSDLIHNS